MATEILRPNGAGDATGINYQLPTTGSHWDKLDEITADDETTYIYDYQDTETIDYYALTNTTIPDPRASINSVTVYYKIHGNPAIVTSMWPYLRLNSTNTKGTTESTYGIPADSWAARSQALARPGGGTWTVSDLNSLQVGVGVEASSTHANNYTWVTQLYVEVDYTLGNVVSPTEVRLNGSRFKTVGKITPHLVSLFADKQVIGDYDKSSDPHKSSWVLVGDQRGGILVEEMDEGKDQNRSWFSTCDTRFQNHLILPDLATSVTVPAIGNFTILLRPLANGTTQEFTSVTSGTHFSNVDEAVADDATTIVYTDGVGADDTDTFTCRNHLTEAGTIVSVTVFIRYYMTGADTHNAYPVVRTHSTNYSGTAATTDGSYATASHTWTTNPNTSSAWSWTEIDDMEIGGRIVVSGAGPNARLSQVYATVIYTPSSYNVHFENFNGGLYMARGNVLHKLNAAADEFATLGSAYPSVITDLKSSLGSSLYIGQGSSEYYYLNTSDTATQTSKLGAYHFVEWDGKLFCMDDYDNQIYYTATPNTAAPTWTGNGTLSQVPVGSIRALDVDVDSTSSPVVYVSTNKGVWAHDYTNAQFVRPQMKTPEHTNGGRGFGSWHSGLYYSSGLDIYYYVADNSPAIVANVGLNQRDGLPTEYAGEIMAATPGFSEFFFSVDAGQTTGTGYSAIYAINDSKIWRCLWADATADQALGASIVSSAVALNLWFYVGSSIYKIPLSPGAQNPLKIASKTYATSALHITPWFDANWQVGNKLAIKLRVNVGGDVSADETVTVKYRTNHEYTDLDSEWTTLGAIVSSGETEYSFGSSLGVTFKSIQFRFDLARAGASTTETPDVFYATLEYTKVLPKKWGWDFTADCSHEYDGKSPEQQLDALVTAAELETHMPFMYEDTVKYVTVRSIQGSHITGTNPNGEYAVSVMEV